MSVCFDAYINYQQCLSLTNNEYYFLGLKSISYIGNAVAKTFPIVYKKVYEESGNNAGKSLIAANLVTHTLIQKSRCLFSSDLSGGFWIEFFDNHESKWNNFLESTIESCFENTNDQSSALELIKFTVETFLKEWIAESRYFDKLYLEYKEQIDYDKAFENASKNATDLAKKKAPEIVAAKNKQNIIIFASVSSLALAGVGVYFGIKKQEIKL